MMTADEKIKNHVYGGDGVPRYPNLSTEELQRILDEGLLVSPSAISQFEAEIARRNAQTDDLSDHPFSPESVARESGALDRSERAWLRWAAEAERLLGHDLDGDDVDQAGCGYSMDEAYDVFMSGVPAVSYVAMVVSRDRYMPKAAR